MLLNHIIDKYIKIYFPGHEMLIYGFIVFFSLIIIIFVLISTAYYTLLERKLLATLQSRSGPLKVGYLGLLQPLADGLKLFLKEIIFPTRIYKKIFIFSSIFSFFIALNLWVILDFSYGFSISNINLVFLLIFLLSMFHVYSIIFAGWASNSKYSFLGSLRSSAQLIGYDIAMVLTVLNLVIYTESLTIEGFLTFQTNFGWLVFWFPLNFITFFICILAETNRHPFDLPEAEAELVAGYNVEYSAISFALFFLAEYSAMIFMSVLTVHMFFGGWFTFSNLIFLNYLFYFLKILLVLYLFVFIRALIPRYRYDQLMRIGWKILIPFQIILFIYYTLIEYFFNFDIAYYFKLFIFYGFSTVIFFYNPFSALVFDMLTIPVSLFFFSLENQLMCFFLNIFSSFTNLEFFVNNYILNLIFLFSDFNYILNAFFSNFLFIFFNLDKILLSFFLDSFILLDQLNDEWTTLWLDVYVDIFVYIPDSIIIAIAYFFFVKFNFTFFTFIIHSGYLLSLVLLFYLLIIMEYACLIFFWLYLVFSVLFPVLDIFYFFILFQLLLILDMIEVFHLCLIHLAALNSELYAYFYE